MLEISVSIAGGPQFARAGPLLNEAITTTRQSLVLRAYAYQETERRAHWAISDRGTKCR